MRETSHPEQHSFPDIEAMEQGLLAAERENMPHEKARLLNLKGILLTGQKKYAEADESFRQALASADDDLRRRVLVNNARNNYFADKTDKALDLLGKLDDLLKGLKGSDANYLLGHAHLLRGQIFYRTKNDKKAALNEFKKAEFFFESVPDLAGVGGACMEIARIHLNANNLQTTWNYLRKSENCLSRYQEEAVGVFVCKAVALYHSKREEEAERMLRELYKTHEEFGKGNYMYYEILDAYLDVHSKTSDYVVSHSLK